MGNHQDSTYFTYYFFKNIKFANLVILAKDIFFKYGSIN